MRDRKDITEYRLQQLKYVVADLLSSMLVWVAFLVFRWLIYDERFFTVDNVLVPAFNFYQPLIFYPLACLVVHYLFGYYLRPSTKAYGKDFLRTLVSSALISLGAFFCIIIDDAVEHYHLYYHSLLVLFGLQFVLTYLPRLALTIYSHYQIRTGKYPNATVIIGDNARIHSLQQEVPELRNAYTLSSKKINTFHDFRKKHGIRHAIIALNENASEMALYDIIHRIYPEQVTISFPPRVFDMLTGAAKITEINDTPFVNITEQPMSDSSLCIKRAFDVGVSIVCLIVLFPVFLGVAIAIRCNSKGPIIYSQERIGLYGRPFRILKFRTMYTDAESHLPQLAQEEDPRITRVGRILRKYRLDELPQFWNIVRGDMSIVGPRPERAYYINQIIQQAPYYCLLYKIRPGLTSWGPIRVGYTDTLEKMLRRLNYDIVYIENMSIRLDINIMFHTFKVIIDGKGQ